MNRTIVTIWRIYNVVAQHKDSPKRLWSSFPSVLGRTSRSPSHPIFSAEDFLQMLTQKIDNICVSTAGAPLQKYSCTESKFESFRPILETELYLVIKLSNLKSSEL